MHGKIEDNTLFKNKNGRFAFLDKNYNLDLLVDKNMKLRFLEYVFKKGFIQFPTYTNFNEA